MRTLVTGGDGFIGSHLDLEGDVMVIDRKRGTDIFSSFDAIRAFDPEVVFHLAAHHYIPWTEEHPDETQRLNVAGTHAVMASCGLSMHTFVLASSAAIYGFGSTPMSEDSAQLGRGVYARSKQHAEQEMAWYVEKLRPNIRAVAARLFNVVGPGDTWPHLLPSVIEQHMSRQGVTVGNSWPQRDYIHVEDVGVALKILARQAPEGFSAWNVGTGIGTSVGELVAKVGEISGRRVQADVAWQKSRSDDGHLIADPSSLRNLGWYPMRTLDDAIADVLQASPVLQE